MSKRSLLVVLGGRKFILAIASVGSGFVLALLHALTADFAGIVMTANVAFNGADAVITRMAVSKGVAKEYGKAPPAAEVA